MVQKSLMAQLCYKRARKQLSTAEHVSEESNAEQEKGRVLQVDMFASGPVLGLDHSELVQIDDLRSFFVSQYWFFRKETDGHN